MSKHLLLIDDDADDIELFGEALNEADPTARFQYFNDATELMNYAANNSIDKPDIIFLDINMSTISGWECLHFLKAHEWYRNVPIIMYSTSSHKREVAQALQQGATGFVTKPNNFKQLIEMLRKVIISDGQTIGEKLAGL